MNMLNFLLGALLLFTLMITSCSKNADSTAQFVFKTAPQEGLVADIAGEQVTRKEMEKGIEVEIYELEQKLYELRFNALKR